jgi:hypothetical protein
VSIFRLGLIPLMSKLATSSATVPPSLVYPHLHPLPHLKIESPKFPKTLTTGESCPTRCILIYSGIHYDALAYTFLPSVPDADITVHQIYPPSEPPYSTILKGAKEMAQRLKERGYHVDTATFNIVCEQCGRGFRGEKEAVKHAGETGHTAFGQIPTEEDG